MIFFLEIKYNIIICLHNSFSFVDNFFIFLFYVMYLKKEKEGMFGTDFENTFLFFGTKKYRKYVEQLKAIFYFLF